VIDVLQRRITELIEAELYDPPPSRARRYLEDTKGLLPAARDFDGGGALLSVPILLPFLLPAAITTVGVERLQARRRSAAFKRQVAHLRAVVATLESVAREGGTTATYRRAAGSAALLTASPEIVALCTEAESALLVRYTVRTPRPWQKGRAFDGVALFALAATGPVMATNASNEGAATKVSELAALLAGATVRALSCPLERESWAWEKGSPESLNIVSTLS
jgi:hypothetical protein